MRLGVISDLREQIAESEPSLEVEFVGIVPDVIGDLDPEPIEIKLFSEEQLLRVKPKSRGRHKKIPGVADTNSGVIISGPAITFRVDPKGQPVWNNWPTSPGTAATGDDG